MSTAGDPMRIEVPCESREAGEKAEQRMLQLLAWIPSSFMLTAAVVAELSEGNHGLPSISRKQVSAFDVLGH